MEEINTSRLFSDIDETLNTFKLLQKSFTENLVKERHEFEETEESFDEQFTKFSGNLYNTCTKNFVSLTILFT